MAEDELGIPRGSIRATVLIETIPAAFEMDEILYELREHSAGLNCGRWDYIFSIIKKFCKDPGVHHAGPGAGHHDRALHALVFAAGDQDLPSPGHSCHRRHGRPDPHQERSAGQRRGHGESPGRQGARGGRRPRRHVGCPPRPGAAGQSVLRRPHAAAQPDRPPPRRRAGDGRGPADASPRARSPSAGCARTSTWASNTWPPGWRATAACRIYNLMEDAATAEISRAQIWQWVHQPNGVLSDGRKITPELVRRLFQEQMDKLRAESSGRSTLPAAISTWRGS